MCEPFGAPNMSSWTQAQAMMFMAGANSIFTGDKLLTTANPKFSEETGWAEELQRRCAVGFVAWAGQKGQTQRVFRSSPETACRE